MLARETMKSRNDDASLALECNKIMTVILAKYQNELLENSISLFLRSQLSTALKHPYRHGELQIDRVSTDIS
jgi:hypothetical protein